jgi:hypothetical protein
MKKHLASITILIKDRQAHSPQVNQLLTENGHLILARLGVNVQRHCIEHCTAVITVVLEASTKEIKDLTEKLNGIYGIVAKKNVMTE